MKYLVVSLMAMLAFPMAHASSGDCRDGSCNTGAEVITTNSLGGDRSTAVGLSHALGDVAIAQCLATTQWATILVSKQKVILNLWCVAEVYDRKGMHDNAAKSRCAIGEIVGMHDSEALCIIANTWKPPLPPDPVEPSEAAAADVEDPPADVNALAASQFDDFVASDAQRDERHQYQYAALAKELERERDTRRLNAQAALDKLPQTEEPTDGN